MNNISNGQNASGQERIWQDDGEVVRLTLPPTDGTTGRQWIERARKSGTVSSNAISTLYDKYFNPTKGVVNKIAIIRGAFFADGDRKTKDVRTEAKKRGYLNPNPEDACLIREVLTDEDIREMGFLRIVTMHKALQDGDGVPL